MADYIRITRGKDRLREKLNALVPGVNEAINEANRASAEELSDAIKRVAPVGPTGEYQKSIRAAPVDDNAGRLDQAITTTFRSKGKKGGTVTRTARAEGTLAWGIFALYVWKFLEFGTSKMGAQPHVYPTFRSLKKRIRSRLSRAVNKRIKDVAR